MRVRVAAFVVIVTASADVSAHPPPRRRAPAPPPAVVAAEAPTTAGVVALWAPSPDAILVRAGTFTMGSSDVEIAAAIQACKQEPSATLCAEIPRAYAQPFLDESGPREVALDDFWMDRTEVPLGRYRRCVAAGRCAEPPYADGGDRFDRPDFPVVLVTWQESAAFCAWAGGRLPTEAEWERAARGRSGRRYPWGEVYNPVLANHGRLGWDRLDGGDGALELGPVGSFPDGRTPDGIADLAGNVEEWVGDWYSPDYPQTSEVNPTGPEAGTANAKVVRGGGYATARPWLRGAARGFDDPGARRSWRGFRCVYPVKGRRLERPQTD